MTVPHDAKLGFQHLGDFHYNPANGTLGSGPSYGESSFNRQPHINAPLSDFWSNTGRSPYDPFSPPNLRPTRLDW